MTEDFNDILAALCGRIEALGVQMFPHTRPTAVDSRMKEFAVVGFNAGIRSNEIGGYHSEFDWLSSTMVIEIFVRDKNKAQQANEPNTKRLGELQKQAINLFPWRDKETGIEFFRPYILAVCNSDGEGFHYTRLSSRMSTLVDSD